ncbi:MAG: hypothetical protein IIC82_10000 [Chloroflexi bacterium]|nr:hypothetical protein [Chloroflexota bacterium]
MPLSGVLSGVMASRLLPDAWYRPPLQSRLRRIIHRAARDNGLGCHFSGRSGRRFLMFTYGDAVKVVQAATTMVKGWRFANPEEAERLEAKSMHAHAVGFGFVSDELAECPF